ncbi:MAG: hypothetical protein JW908_10865 [Anaerolineales bacterium]|nr:hypothetical protein [Anaerolineales bacterium]
MNDWHSRLKIDPIPALLASNSQAICYYSRRDLLNEPSGEIQTLWQLPGVLKILKKQLPDGSWTRSGENKHPAINIHLIETFRHFRFLVEQYGITRDHPQGEKAAEYLFSCQTEEGDFRGILANQYATYYTGAIKALLIQAGYGEDPRIEKAFRWLLSMRQDDLGWSIPLITHKLDRETQYHLTTEYTEPVQPDRSKPFCNNGTGMILRAFAVHERYRQSEAAITAANLLKSRFFQENAYTSYRDASYWVRFEYPFWWNNLVSALDSMSRIGLPRDDAQIQQALQWLVDHQQVDGLWNVTYAKVRVKENVKTREMRYWITLAICRIFRRFYG